MELKDLTGMFTLSGYDTGIEKYTEPRYDWMTDDEPDEISDNDATWVTFILDGKTIKVSEDPSDGYRSSMKDVQIGGQCNNTFPPVKVIAKFYHDVSEIPGDDHRNLYGMSNGPCEILCIFDAETESEVIRVGTDYSEDYYPHFVHEWHPEAMATNRKFGLEDGDSGETQTPFADKF